MSSTTIDIIKEKNISLLDFEIIALIGKGAYGTIYLVKHDNEYLAMKVISKHLLSNEINQGLILNEKIILQSFNQEMGFPFIPRLKYSFQDKKFLFLITDFYQGGELYFHLKKVGHFNEEATKFYLAQIVLIINYLHNHQLIYGDLKPENLMLGTDGYINLCDYGLSKYCYEIEQFITADDLDDNNEEAYKKKDKDIVLGTPNYLSPEQTQKICNMKNEIKKELKYTNNQCFEDDIWGIGIVFYELITGLCPFTSNEKDKLYKEISNHYDNLEFPIYLSEEAKNLLKGLITTKDHRLTLPQIMKHPFFDNINWDDIVNKKRKAPFMPKLRSPTDLKYFNATLCSKLEEDDYISHDNNSVKSNEEFEKAFLYGFDFNFELKFKTSNISTNSLPSQTTNNASSICALSCNNINSKNDGETYSLTSYDLEKESI